MRSRLSRCARYADCAEFSAHGGMCETGVKHHEPTVLMVANSAGGWIGRAGARRSELRRLGEWAAVLAEAPASVVPRPVAPRRRTGAAAYIADHLDTYRGEELG